MITKSQTNLLIVGCGDIGIRLAHLLNKQGVAVSGLRRSVQALPDFIAPVRCDLNDERQVAQVFLQHYDSIVFTLVPQSLDEGGYRQTFGYNLTNIVQALAQAPARPKTLLFVSSTSVYAQDNGEWVDETSPATATTFNGQWLLQAEQKLLANKALNTTIVRLSGIYGPGRERLINKVREGAWDANDAHFTNRIHADDCAGVLHFLLQQSRKTALAPIYLASDDEPAPMNVVCNWLALKLHGPNPSSLPEVTTLRGKRCSSRLIRDAGYQFLYPGFREGYADILNKKFSKL